MSASWLKVIPTDPAFVPTPSSGLEALRIVCSFAPEAEQARIVDEGKVIFIDAGTNFERIECCHCSAPIDLDWWGARMDVAELTDFNDLGVQAPCCGAQINLNDLEYFWPQGFARWRIEILNPDISEVSEIQISSVEGALERAVRVIYAHY